MNLKKKKNSIDNSTFISTWITRFHLTNLVHLEKENSELCTTSEYFKQENKINLSEPKKKKIVNTKWR